MLAVTQKSTELVAWTDEVGYTRVTGVLYTLLKHNDVSIFNNADELMSKQRLPLILNLMINGDQV